ncbi:dymeclin isoform X6 [Rattus norvegicus]|uniref:dymeclin isoform X6 n=1 Tax=Rattus norvegicus TaxID=10116 RepID=UPI002FD81927
MGSNSSKISDLPKNEYLKRLSGPEAISENDPFWNQLFSFSFSAPTSSTELKLLEEATISVCKSLVENNPRTGNLAALTKVFLARTRELRLSAECQNHIFIWQTHNALFIICCLLKVFICEMSEEELQLHFTYEEKLPGTYTLCVLLGSDSEDLLEELLCSLIQLITDTPLLDITYEISVEAISAMIVFLSCQLFHKEVLRQSISHKYLMQGPCLPYTSKLVKTLLYNFIRQEKPPPPGTHVFPQQSDGGGLLYGLASGVANSSPFPSSVPHTFQINFNSLYTTLCEQQTSDQATLLLYTLLHQNANVRTYMLARTDMENLVLPILEILYHVEERNSHHVYMALIILLILTEDDGFNRSIHEVILKNITWYSERVLTEISLGSLLILVVIRTIQYNMTRTRDKYLHTNCLAALANMSAQFRSLHQYAAQRIISLFSLLSKKHNKVLEQATQSLRGSLSSSDVPLPDYAQDLSVIEEVIRMMLEIINSCLTNSLHHNPNLVYALLYKRDLFEQFRTHPSFQDIMQNIDLVISFFSSRLLQSGAELSVERVLEIIKQGVVALPKDRLKKFPELKFKYVEEEQPEEFFIPYVWSLVYNSAVGLYWNPQDIQLFAMDSD